MTVHPVDEVLPAPKLFALGLQHVLVMYAGAVAVPLIIDGETGAFLNPAYGALDNLALALFVLAAILVIAKYGRGFVANVSVLLGLALGMLLAVLMGKVSFAGLDEAPSFDLVYPFQFGLPT